MTDREAKELLARRYRKRGFPVQRIRKFENSYLVVFGTDAKGRGLGPGGLSSTRCNPPTKERGVQLELPIRRRGRDKYDPGHKRIGANWYKSRTKEKPTV